MQSACYSYDDLKLEEKFPIVKTNISTITSNGDEIIKVKNKAFNTDGSPACSSGGGMENYHT